MARGYVKLGDAQALYATIVPDKMSGYKRVDPMITVTLAFSSVYVGKKKMELTRRVPGTDGHKTKAFKYHNMMAVGSTGAVVDMHSRFNGGRAKYNARLAFKPSVAARMLEAW